jgi:hypothetical protein
MKRWFVAGLILGAASTAQAQFSDIADGEQYKILGEYRFWAPTLGAQIEKDPTGGVGTLIDVPGDLGVPNHSTFQLRGILQLGQGHKIRVSYSRIDYDGDTKIDRQLRFGGTVYTINSHVVTSVKSDYYTAEYEWDAFKGQSGYFGFLIGAKGLNATTVLLDEDRGDRKQEAVHVPVPVLGVAGRYYAGKLSLFGEFSGLTIGSRGHVYELDLGVHAEVVRHIGASLAYRRITVHGEQPDEGLLDFKLGGVNVGADVRF